MMTSDGMFDFISLKIHYSNIQVLIFYEKITVYPSNYFNTLHIGHHYIYLSQNIVFKCQKINWNGRLLEVRVTINHEPYR